MNTTQNIWSNPGSFEKGSMNDSKVGEEVSPGTWHCPFCAHTEEL